MKKVLVIIIGTVIVGSIGWLVIANRDVPEQSSNEPQLPPAGEARQKVPDFALQNYEDQTVRLADFAGIPIVINSWAAWCPFCRKELVDFATIQKEFGDKIAIIAIDRAETRAVAKKYTDEVGVTDDLVFLLDPGDAFYQSVGGFSMPETIFVDKDGTISFHKRGPMGLDEMREKIQQLISQ